MRRVANFSAIINLFTVFSPQGRVTDHRIGLTEHCLELFLEGEDKLNDMILALQSQHEAEALQELTTQYTAGVDKHVR